MIAPYIVKIVGTFGQEKRWQLGVPSSYQHPMAPSDTLLDPKSIAQQGGGLRTSCLEEDFPEERRETKLSVESVVSMSEEQAKEDVEGEERNDGVFDVSESESSGTEVINGVISSHILHVLLLYTTGLYRMTIIMSPCCNLT